MTDLTFHHGSFSDGVVTITTNTDSGREFLSKITGCSISVASSSIRKSQSGRICDMAEHSGLTVRHQFS